MELDNWGQATSLVLLRCSWLLSSKWNGRRNVSFKWSSESCSQLISNSNPVCQNPLAITYQYWPRMQNSSNTVQRQFSAALTAPYQLSPGQSWPPGTQFGSSGIKGSNSKLAPGAIAGIVIGGLLFVIIAALCYFVGRSRTYHQIMRARRRRQETLRPINANGSTMDPQNILNTSSGYGQKGAWSGREGVELHQRPGPIELYA